METRLRHAQKMKAIGKLTGGVAHDFNNLLQVISGNLQLLVRDVAENIRPEQRVQNAMAGVSRAPNLLRSFWPSVEKQPLAPSVVNLGRLVRGMDGLLRRTLGEGVELETVISGGLWNTFIDHAQVENAILKLAINFRDAMNGHGKLTIETGNALLDDRYTGSGMPRDILDRVFEPFFTTKATGKGTGLGLSMVYGLIQRFASILSTLSTNYYGASLARSGAEPHRIGFKRGRTRSGVQLRRTEPAYAAFIHFRPRQWTASDARGTATGPIRKSLR